MHFATNKTVQAYKQSDNSVVILLEGKKIAMYPSHYSNKPTKRNKYVTLNFFRYKLEWV